ncbi:DUF2786 domain-containing protein [Nocardia terpenica]|uniref:Uncharacterized protein n=1 Tax=Nocardia terpenica TaxID=455432 RepID=A0A6G9Z312_9NOCA|nr:DUF2786 domain-containing protein [Nocardia terpenica]QIS19576.1 hypothetical protein F6W96_16070 [Nocardia terpenica]
MTPDQARIKVDKLRAHAASVGGTPEAALFFAKADELAREHGLPLTDAVESAETPRPARVRPATAPQPSTTTPTPRRTTGMTSTTTKTKPARKATDGTLRQAFNPRARAAFGRNTEPGTEITFYIVAIEEELDLDYYTKAPKLDDEGNERMVPILILQTDGSTKPYGPGLRKLWVRSGVADALIGACLDADVEQVAVGGTGRIRYDGLGEPPAPNFSAPKLYSAVYEPPDGQEVCR